MQKDADLDVEQQLFPGAQIRRATARCVERQGARFEAAQLAPAQLPVVQSFRWLQPPGAQRLVGERRVGREDFVLVAGGLAHRDRFGPGGADDEGQQNEKKRDGTHVTVNRGCASQIPVVDEWPAEGQRFGCRDIVGKLVFCPQSPRTTSGIDDSRGTMIHGA